MKKQLLSLSAIMVTLTMFVGCKDGVSDNPAEVSTSTSSNHTVYNTPAENYQGLAMGPIHHHVEAPHHK